MNYFILTKLIKTTPEKSEVKNSTHSSKGAFEPFDGRSNGSDLSAKTKGRAPVNAVAPARDGAAEGSNGRGEAERSLRDQR